MKEGDIREGGCGEIITLNCLSVSNSLFHARGYPVECGGIMLTYYDLIIIFPENTLTGPVVSKFFFGHPLFLFNDGENCTYVNIRDRHTIASL